MPSGELGFWGAPTASIDWCEANYAHSLYVCEWSNTWSSLAMVVAGLLGLALHWRALEARFLVAFVALSVVGIGSLAFHATLLFELQMLDELPMLYLALVMVFILVENGQARRWGRWFPLALSAHGAFVTVLAAGTRGELQFWAFQLSFGSLELFCLWRVTMLFRGSQNAPVRRLFRVGMSAYALGIVAWFIDLRFCQFVGVTLPEVGLGNPQLHAVWHALVSVGFYCLILLIAHVRLATLGGAPELGRFLGVVPRVVRGEAGSAR